MKTIEEIKREALRVFDNVVILSYNVNNGDTESEYSFQQAFGRLVKANQWAKANGEEKLFANYVATGKFNATPYHFEANNILELI